MATRCTTFLDPLARPSVSKSIGYFCFDLTPNNFLSEIPTYYFLFAFDRFCLFCLFFSSLASRPFLSFFSHLSFFRPKPQNVLLLYSSAVRRAAEGTRTTAMYHHHVSLCITRIIDIRIYLLMRRALCFCYSLDLISFFFNSRTFFKQSLFSTFSRKGLLHLL